MISPAANRLREVCTNLDTDKNPKGYPLKSWPTYLSPGLARDPDRSLEGLQPYQRSAIGRLVSEMGIDAVEVAPREVTLDEYCWTYTPEALIIHNLPLDELALARKFASFAVGENEPKTFTSRIIGMVATANAPTPTETIGFTSQVSQYLETVAKKLENPRFVVPNIDQSFSRELAARYNLQISDGEAGVALNPAVIAKNLIAEASVADREGLDRAKFEEHIAAVCNLYGSLQKMIRSREDVDSSEYDATLLQFQLTLILLSQFERDVKARSANS